MRRVWLLIVIVLPALMGSSKCETTGPKEGDPPKVDTVVGKRVPAESSKKCWEFRIARRSDNRAVDILCVNEREWHRYRVGDKYPK